MSEFKRTVTISYDEYQELKEYSGGHYVEMCNLYQKSLEGTLLELSMIKPLLNNQSDMLEKLGLRLDKMRIEQANTEKELKHLRNYWVVKLAKKLKLI